jgi:hypothetical protein
VSERDRPSSENPFERYDLDPREGARAITERLRELAEDAPEAERAAIRAAWEELTLHPRGRLRAAIAAHPETRAPVAPPPAAPLRKPAEPIAPTLADLAPRPSVLRALRGDKPEPLPVLPPLEDDPLI